MAFELTILGSNSALPAHGRFPTSQILNVHDHSYLIDCGEATQLQFVRFKIKFGKIDHIFISHMHGDHYFGLFGIITTYNLNGRTNPLNIIGPAGLKEVVSAILKHSNTKLGYEIVFHAFEPENGKVVHEDDHVRVESIVMKHRIPTSGFVFYEKHKGLNILSEKIAEYQISVPDIQAIKKGHNLHLPDGRIIPNEELVAPPAALRKYAFCSDTLYNEEVIPYIKNADLLYYEATFDNSLLNRAIETYHSTSGQAGKIATLAAVKRLIIGHFSSRYLGDGLETLLQETRSEFANTDLAIEGTVFAVER